MSVRGLPLGYSYLGVFDQSAHRTADSEELKTFINCKPAVSKEYIEVLIKSANGEVLILSLSQTGTRFAAA